MEFNFCVPNCYDFSVTASVVSYRIMHNKTVTKKKRVAKRERECSLERERTKIDKTGARKKKQIVDALGC